MAKELNLGKVTKIFEKSWNELLDKYEKLRYSPIWCSEADLQLHLAHKLINKLGLDFVHIELPIPSEVELFFDELLYFGRISEKKYKYRSDIVVMNPYKQELYLIAELKFTPIYWSFYLLMRDLEAKQEKKIEPAAEIIKMLKSTVNRIKQWRKYGPSESKVKNVYLKNVDKLIKILSDFKDKEGKVVTGYFCVLDEIYPDIEERLKKEVEKYNPPDQFNLRVRHFRQALEGLEQILVELQEP